jgi:polyisoprenoid-binding protein YceI
MSKRIYPLLAVLILLTSAGVLVDPPKYTVQDGYKISFKSKDPSGVFKTMSGNIQFDKDDLANSKVDFKVKVASISTGNGMKNKKALTSEWFDASNHPYITFKSKKIWLYKEKYYVLGDLTIKGTTKEYKVPMTVAEDGDKLTLTGRFYVKRLEFKVGKPSPNVPDAMKITYSIPVSK